MIIIMIIRLAGAPARTTDCFWRGPGLEEAGPVGGVRGATPPSQMAGAALDQD